MNNIDRKNRLALINEKKLQIETLEKEVHDLKMTKFDYIEHKKGSLFYMNDRVLKLQDYSHNSEGEITGYTFMEKIHPDKALYRSVKLASLEGLMIKGN